MSFDARVFLKQGPPHKKNIVRTTSDIPEKKKNGSRLAKIELVNIKKRNLEGFE